MPMLLDMTSPVRPHRRAARAVVALVLVAESLVAVQLRPVVADEPAPVAADPGPAEPPSPVDSAPPAPARPRPAAMTIMPLGDSITEGFPSAEGYRGILATLLADAGLPVTFVGSQAQRPPGGPALQHEGHGRYRIDQVRAGVPGWMAAAAPDTVLLMAGTNDLLGNFDRDNAPARLAALLDTIATARPTASVLVGSIPPIAPEWCDCHDAVDTYNAALRRLVAGRAAAGYPVSLVDTSAVGLADLADGLHPNEAGYAKLAHAWFRALASLAPAPRAAGPTPPPVDSSYWLVGADGGVFSVGAAGFHGSAAALRLNRPVVAMASTPTGKGYWQAGADGAVLAFGDAPFLGSVAGSRLNRPIVAILAAPTGRGYWLVAMDGGVFAFGDARFLGSTGGLELNRPIVAGSPTPSGGGYWLVASDGGVFAFGDARFAGSAAAIALRSPVVAMAPTPTGAGYWFVAADGGVFAFGDAAFSGSLAGATSVPVAGIAAGPPGAGYVLATAAGEVRGFGGAAVRTEVPVGNGRPVAAVVRAGG